MKVPYIAYHPLPPFSNLSSPSPPQTSLSDTTPTCSVLSVVLFVWLSGCSCHIWCAIVHNVNMDLLHTSSLGTLVRERPWCVFYATRCQIYWGLTHNVAFCWSCDLISHTHTQTHTHTHTHTNTHMYRVHSGASRMTHPYKYIFTPPVMCSQPYLYFIK